MYRQNAEISALSSRELDKYEYLTGKDLEYKPSPLQKAKFEYSPLGQVFNKGLESNERQEGLLKRLKNIEDKTDNLNVNDGSKLKKIDFYNPQIERSRKAAQEINEIINEIKKIKNSPRDKDTKKYQPKFNFIRANKNEDDFNKYIDLRELGNDMQNGSLTLDEAKEIKRQMKHEINDLKNYAAKSDKTKNIKNKVLENVKMPYKGIKNVIKGFEDGDFLIKDLVNRVKKMTVNNNQEVKMDKNLKNLMNLMNLKANRMKSLKIKE